MTINLHMPAKGENLKPTITVVGVGGAGGNAVNNMIAARLEGVNFVISNTDAQALDTALTDRVIQLGANITQGLGAGANPDVGRASAEEAMEEVLAHIQGSHMVFITAGMGGGTGTGAAPVVARAAREQGILTVAVVTKPFHFEGTHRMKLAEAGLEELQKYVDTMIVIPNQNLFRVANEKTTFADAFRMADEVLHSGVRGVTDLMVMPGLINLDFSDIRTVMREMGKAMMGTGESEGDRRAVLAAEAAISNPLLDDVSMKGARGVLINITGGPDMTLFEVDEAANRIRDEVDPDANIIFGSTFNDSMNGKMRVSVVATGIDQPQQLRQDPSQRGGAYGGSYGFSQRSNAAPAENYAAAPATEDRSSAQPASRFSLREKAQQIIRSEEKPLAVTLQEESDVFDYAPRAAVAPMMAAPVPAPVAAPVMPAASGRHAPTRAESMSRAAEEEAYHAAAAYAEMHEEMPSLQLEPVLAGPRAVQQRQPQPQPAPTQQPELWDRPEAAEQEDEPNFMRRMTARFTHRDEAHSPRSEVVMEPRSAAPNEGDYLEIPAFLRRQAN